MFGGRTLQRKERAQQRPCGKRNYYSFKELKGLYKLSTDSKSEWRETVAKPQRASRLSI